VRFDIYLRKQILKENGQYNWNRFQVEKLKIPAQGSCPVWEFSIFWVNPFKQTLTRKIHQQIEKEDRNTHNILIFN